MMTLEMIMNTIIANCDVDVLNDAISDAFMNTYGNYHMDGKYYPQTLESPAEYPEFIADGYEDYVDMVIDELLGYFSDYDDKDRQLISDNLEKICNELDVEFYDEDTYITKAIDRVDMDINWYA